LSVKDGKLSEETKQKMSDKAKERFADKENHPMYGKHHSSETKSKMIESAKLRHKNNPNPFKGKSHSDESIQKIKDKWANKEKIKCPHCDMESINMSVMSRWHLDNCKHKKTIGE